ncbi:Metalloprotease mig-17 [Bulinus truncatus]|nr:Metalloprotease mig-17 [Bulinus truncatus]
MCDVSSHDRLQTFSTCLTFVTICNVVPSDPNTVPGKFQFGNRSQILYLNISSTDVNDDRLPNDINVIFQTDTNTSTELNLKRVDHITSNVPIYTIDTDDEGVKIKKEDVKGNENVAFYQDTRNDAVIQVFRQNSTDNQTGDFKITRGEYQEGNVRYSILPVVRSKRQTSEHSDQSDFTIERYDIRKIETSRETWRDYLTAPPEFESSKSGSLLNEKLQDGAKFSRSRRQSGSTYYVDVTAFLDYTCYNRFVKDAYNYESKALSRIQEYYAFIFSGSTNAFKLFYFYNYMYVETTKVNTEAVLSNFTLFLNSTAGRDFSFPYDHAMLFVGSDLRTENSNILGLAWVKTLCRTDGASASVIEDTGDYSAIITGAHELGHSLAANHDGENNTCSYIDRYLMASSDSVPTYSTRLNPWRFSSCSIDSIVSYLISLGDTARGQTCLSDALTVVGEFPDVSERLLGQKFPSNQQCQFKYGSSSYDCNAYLQNSTTELCYIYCKQPMSSYCYGQEALSGTSCGCGKVCRQGDCVIDLSVPSTGCDIFTNCTTAMCQDASVRRYCDRTCWYYNTLTTTVKEDICKDSYYVPSLNTTCRSALGESENLCYKLDVQTNCCVSCAQRLTNITGCEYGDRYKRLCSSVQSCKVYRDACCNTCRAVVGEGNRTFPDQIFMLILNLTVWIYFINFY